MSEKIQFNRPIPESFQSMSIRGLKGSAVENKSTKLGDNLKDLLQDYGVVKSRRQVGAATEFVLAHTDPRKPDAIVSIGTNPLGTAGIKTRDDVVKLAERDNWHVHVSVEVPQPMVTPENKEKNKFFVAFNDKLQVDYMQSEDTYQGQMQYVRAPGASHPGMLITQTPGASYFDSRTRHPVVGFNDLNENGRVDRGEYRTSDDHTITENQLWSVDLSEKVPLNTPIPESFQSISIRGLKGCAAENHATKLGDNLKDLLQDYGAVKSKRQVGTATEFVLAHTDPRKPDAIVSIGTNPQGTAGIKTREDVVKLAERDNWHVHVSVEVPQPMVTPENKEKNKFFVAFNDKLQVDYMQSEDTYQGQMQYVRAPGASHPGMLITQTSGASYFDSRTRHPVVGFNDLNNNGRVDRGEYRASDDHTITENQLWSVKPE